MINLTGLTHLINHHQSIFYKSNNDKFNLNHKAGKLNQIIKNKRINKKHIVNCMLKNYLFINNYISYVLNF